MLYFAIKNENLCVMDEEEIVLSELDMFLEYFGNKYNEPIIRRTQPWTLETPTIAAAGGFSLCLDEYDGFLTLRPAFANEGEDIEKTNKLVVTCNYPEGIDTAFINRPMRMNGLVINEMQNEPAIVHPVAGDVLESSEFAGAVTQGSAFVLGPLTFEKWFTEATVSREGCLSFASYLERHTLHKGETFTGETVLLAEGCDLQSALLHYAETTADYAGVSRIEDENPTGFCTWYYYLFTVTPRRIRDNLAALKENREKLPVKIVQIDDGWFDGYGQWKVKERFGGNGEAMKQLAQEIKDDGYTPGLWLAPYWGQDLHESHPDWFVKTETGEAYGNCLDFTVPEVREHIGKIFHTVTYDWGFGYLKLDIITPNLCGGVYNDPDATAMVNYKLALQLIRDNVPEDTFVLGCTAPFGPAMGLVDGMRVSGDIFETWGSVKGVFTRVFKRWYMHRNWFLNDADCLIIRKTENEDEECMRPCIRDDNEIRTYVTAMAASGGILMLSDKLSLLSEAQIDMIAKLFPAAQHSAYPVDLTESAIPSVLDFGTKGKTRTVALINWSDRAQTLSFEAEEALVSECWTGEFFVHHGGKLAANLKAHEAKVFYLTEISEVAVIASDACVAMQTEWDKEQTKDGYTVTIHHVKAQEMVTLAVQNGLTVGECMPFATCGEYALYRTGAEKVTIR